MPEPATGAHAACADCGAMAVPPFRCGGQPCSVARTVTLGVGDTREWRNRRNRGTRLTQASLEQCLLPSLVPRSRGSRPLSRCLPSCAAHSLVPRSLRCSSVQTPAADSPASNHSAIPRKVTFLRFSPQECHLPL